MATATLTERYIAAAIRSIPPGSRDDVQAELEVSIADAVEARLEQGEQREPAERAVLTELGDPGVLAAGYADRPLHLIGPRFYLSWWRLLKLLWIIVPVCAMGGVAIAQALDDASVGEVIGSAVSVGLAVVVHVGFWVTLVFFILERTGTATALPEWDVDQLPVIQPKGAGRAELIASLSFLVIAIGALFWDRFRGFVRSDDGAVPILNPDLWPWWIVGLFVLKAAESALVIAVYLTGRWNAGFAVINSALALAFAVPAMGLLIAGQLVNPEFLEVVFADNGVETDVFRILAVLTGAGIIGFALWDVVDGWLKTARDNRR